ncbi:tetratricopeptide repeat protein [Undibacterium sp.]|uniref:tetratricopeptide repeat protein n=1 Tax=Undibacterium sp. TaxID=1914977 RepID=UPI00272F154B|nr:tetratricopeptide repeat protein [Undibacterium sp.]MDP1977278.1 tetratricopeptide repeat protein [Undibacterium sp.]
MRNLPQFFVENQLNVDAEERDVKRAYARKLKQIDQENDLQGFQDLRDAYEEALTWLKYREQFQWQLPPKVMPQEEHEDGIAIGATETEAPVTDEISLQNEVNQDDLDAALPLQTQATASAATQQEPENVQTADVAINSAQVAKEIFNEMLAAMRLHSEDGDDDFAGKNLTALLDDTRLFHMETRLLFEGMLAEYLLQGWQPGNGELFDVAVQNFGWEKDRLRLLQLGRPGRVIDRALSDAAEFYRKDKKAREKLWVVIKKIRKEKSPGQRYLKANLGLLRHMQDTYLSWLLLVASKENLAQWSADAEEIQSSNPIGDQRVMPHKEDNNAHPAYWIVIAFVVLVGMFSNKDRSTPSYDPGKFTSADGTSFVLERPDRSLTPQQRVIKAERLLSMNWNQKANFKQAVRTLESAAGDDSSEAAYRLGWLFRDGKFAPADEQRQYAWFLRAAELGHTQASIIVGDLLMDGLGGKPNYKEAFQHYKKAADQGDAQGQFKLAYMLDRGYGIKPDKAVAARLVKASADKGFAHSESLMGQFHLRGEYGFPRDEVKSANWFSLSAKHGDRVGERYFGLVHEQGLGTYKINLAEAAKWYGKARDHGDKDAVKSLQRLCKKQEFSECKPTPASVSTISVVTKAK